MGLIILKYIIYSYLVIIKVQGAGKYWGEGGEKKAVIVITKMERVRG
jgi:hypothetical protein